jgi:hypothetical protein
MSTKKSTDTFRPPRMSAILHNFNYSILQTWFYRTVHLPFTLCSDFYFSSTKWVWRKFWESHVSPSTNYISVTIERISSQWGLMWLSNSALFCLHHFTIPEHGYSEHIHLYERYLLQAISIILYRMSALKRLDFGDVLEIDKWLLQVFKCILQTVQIPT